MTVQYCYKVGVAPSPGVQGGVTVCGIAASAEEACERAKQYAEDRDLVNDEAHVVELQVLCEIDFGLPGS